MTALMMVAAAFVWMLTLHAATKYAAG